MKPPPLTWVCERCGRTFVEDPGPVHRIELRNRLRPLSAPETVDCGDVLARWEEPCSS